MAMGVLADFVQRQLVELGHDAQQRALQFVQAAALGRQARRLDAPTSTCPAWRRREEVEGHVELAGDQVAVAQLGAQAAAHQRSMNAR
jgi:hypothetical protein